MAGAENSSMGVLVTIGMPLFNGERYIEGALRSLLAQSCGDFELLISDNCSTDRTADICRDYASRDQRISFHRNDANVGLARNQNSVIHRGRGKYFLLAHHDDIRSPDYLSATIPVMDQDESVVVCYTATQDIDEHGGPVERFEPELQFDSDDLRARFRDVIRIDHLCEPDFGLTRMSVLKRTRLHGNYADSDRVLLTELALHGRFHKLSTPLFFRRAHDAQSTATARSRQARTLLFDPAHKGKLIFPHFRQLSGYLDAIRRAPIGWRDRLYCRVHMLHWMRANQRDLIGDLDFAGREILRPVKRALVGPGRS